MFKSIPPSDISQRKFRAYKKWTQTESDFAVIKAFSEKATKFFDTETATKAGDICVSPLWHSIKSKYYSNPGDVFLQTGVVKNPATFETERQITDTIYVIQVPQLKYGEQIKKGSVVLQDITNDITYSDNGFGGLTSETSKYIFTQYDAETQTITFVDSITSSNIDLTLSYFDINSGVGTFSYGGYTENLVVLQVDFESNLIYMSEDINFPDLELNTDRFGNVFYDDGLIVLTNSDDFTEYSLTYRSIEPISETEILITVGEGEFNISQNPTAVDVIVFQTSSFETTPYRNVEPGGTVKIKEVLDIRQKSQFYGSYGNSTGSWNDYFESSSIDPTGSYLTPYITTIGFYDDNDNMLAVAKLPRPIKNLPDYNINFIVRFDT